MPLYIFKTSTGGSSGGSGELVDHAATHLANASDPIPWTQVNGAGTLLARPLAAPENEGYLYFATDVNGGTAYRSNGSEWVQYTAGVVLDIPATAVTPGTYSNAVIEVGVDGRITSAQSTTEVRQLLIINSDNQTTFQLNLISTRPDLSRLFLNGVKAFYGLEYVIDSSVLTWIGIGLETTDELEITYL